MVLKSLILQGFKSFPDKTEIFFNGGLTAIVGPNGSGKSNISDAIRWVLGEQSTRSLRGAKMEDVIFSGTAKRGPVGFAEVSLILDNSENVFKSDYTEIMVTRRYYRSGESEYYINRKHCRLKDIHELFMDTGLGRDGYSIIGQGRIDEILSVKSEDRREIFEEAAGITKFRYRKEEAERRLSAVEENLVRINDIYDELERQKGPLETQAEKAKKYLILRDELRLLEVSIWLLKLKSIKADTEILDRKTSICAAQLSDAEKNRDEKYGTSEQLSSELRNIDRETENLRQNLREYEKSASEHNGRAEVIKANIKNNKENIDRAKNESESRTAQAHNLGTQLTERRSRIELLELQKNSIQAKLDEFYDKGKSSLLEKDTAQNKLLAIESETDALKKKLHSIELEKAAAEAGLSGMDERRNAISSDVEKAEQRLSEEQKNHIEMEQRLNSRVETIENAENKKRSFGIKAESVKKKTAILENKLKETQAGFTDSGNRVKMLKDMERDYEGFSRSVKAVMSKASKGGLKGVHGPVSSLVSVQDKFVTAIDTALGASASSIVVDTASDGKACILYLKNSDGGRATFLPLDTIRPNSLKENGLENQTGCYGTADRLLDFDRKYESIVKNLLARTVVSENMDTALSTAKAYKNRFRIVTLDGQIIQSGGAMTGGSASRGTGALARKAKLKNEEERLKEFETRKNQAELEYKASKEELYKLEYELNEIEALRVKAKQEEAGLRGSVIQHEALLESLEKNLEGLKRERDSLEEAGEQYRKTVSECSGKLEAVNAGLSEAEEKVSEAKTAIDEIEKASAGDSERINRLQTELVENRTALAAEQRSLSEMEQLKDELDKGVIGAGESISFFESEIQKLGEELEAEKESAKAMEESAENTKKQIEKQLEIRERTEGEKVRTDREAQGMNDQILSLEREKARLENQKSQIKNEEAKILDNMWERYELTPSSAMPLAKEPQDLNKAKTRVQELKGLMKALGNVNLDAVDEYQKVLERYTFMKEQKDDLEKSKNELYKVLSKLTQNMKEIFSSEFSKLNAFFGETFKEIFGGGHAELQLADTSDVLNCGIEIRVSPPGKSVKSITLLSGGEKAFVAIALYFAILKLRPTPFCVLDEIEAALDDVNVARYAQYIRRLTGSTQFIVITHRRGTMEEADMLYGVTMQEQGVSRLLMLNLAEAEKRLGIGKAAS